MANGVGRVGAFHAAAESVRSGPPTLTPEGGYRRTSVLDTLQPSGNGMSGVDRERLLMNVSGSRLGQAESTFDRSLWLRSERPASLYKTEGGQ